MALLTFREDIDADGIAVFTWDMANRSMNVIDLAVLADLEAIAARIASDAAIKGAVFTSAKEAFSGGADLAMLAALTAGFQAELASAGRAAAVQRLFDESSRLSRLLRRLETAGKPLVAALNGTALGGAFELALACHHRIVADDARIKLGLPEVKVGLMPGAGGTQRVARLVNPQDALQMLLKGEQLSPQRAKALGLVDAVVPSGELLAAAKAWFGTGPQARQPWDRDGFKLPGGKVYSPQGANLYPAATALYRRETHDNYPAARAILTAFVEGVQLPFDTALRVESRYFAHVLQTKEAAAMVRSLFVSMQALNKLVRRPAGVPASAIRRIGIVGAGFMGAGIAHVSARAGIEVVLIDRDDEAAAKGKATVEAAIAREVGRGRASEADKAATLARIEATTDFGRLAGTDLVIEAVFEDRAVKEAVIAQIEAAIGPETILGSNTSTLPITSLAAASRRPERFVGIHFFSPVERMLLVEVIRAKKTGDAAIARALDFTRLIRKTPIVVNDSRGFYTSRVVETYIGEGHRMLGEGVPAALIENAARLAGMPVGPLALNDEVALDLTLRIMAATRKDLGADAVPEARWRLIDRMVTEHGRLGRKNRKGFYDYPENPRDRKRLWAGLAELQPPCPDVDAIDVGELKHRFLAIQALETARCFAEGVLTDVREADVGSIIGFGFAPFTGGTLSYIDFMGAQAFVALCDRLARRHGARFKPNRLLRDLAKAGETFYGRFPPAAGGATERG